MSKQGFQQQEIVFSDEEKTQMLESFVSYLKGEIIKLQEDIIKPLKEENMRLRAALFGTKSERLINGKFDIEIKVPAREAEESSEQKGERKSKPRAHKRKITANYTKVVKQTILPEEVIKEPDKYELLPESCVRVSRRVEIIPAQVLLVEYLCRACVPKGKRGKEKQFAPIYAKAPETIMKGSKVGESVLGKLIWNRYGLNIPFNRQIGELERIGLSGLSEPVICYWGKQASKALKPIYEVIHKELLTAESLQIDETPVRCLKLKDEENKTKKNGYMWALNNPANSMSLYYWHDSRTSEAANLLLRDGMKENGARYSGALVSDGYKGYDCLMKELSSTGKQEWQSCWAHVRRKFIEAELCSTDAEWSRQILLKIAQFYQIEAELKENKSSSEEILQRRDKETRPLVEEFFNELKRKLLDTKTPPLNKLRKAIDYTLSREEQLCTWLDNASIPIDNNGVERAIRPIAVGRHNSLFIGAPSAGERSAILYTLMKECKRKQVDAEAWLTEVLKLLPTYKGDYRGLLPGNLTLPKIEKATLTL